MERIFRTLVVVASVIFLSFLASGCTQKKSQIDVTSVPVESMKDTEGEAAEVEPLESKPLVEEEPDILEGRTNAPMLPIYFDFDKSHIREDQRHRLQKNADYILEDKPRKVLIEGNCDERGTNEYNMALGERRALNAKKYLVNLGVKDTDLETISYGEERPLLYGHDELSWDQNRRNDFVTSN
jgi:peptidoglycan-associated lipoprotein